MTHLILHKVRGEPAFDIAELMEVGDEAWWIIPTSGHRAYPYRHWSLTDVCVLAEFYRSVTNFKDPAPDDWPDHYAPVDLPAKKGMGASFNIGKILDGLLVGKIRRRV